VDLRSNGQRGKGEEVSPAVRVPARCARGVDGGDVLEVTGGNGDMDEVHLDVGDLMEWSSWSIASRRDAEGRLESVRAPVRFGRRFRRRFPAC
jgi:hypothetical protein